MDAKDLFTIAVWGPIVGFMLVIGLRDAITSDSRKATEAEKQRNKLEAEKKEAQVLENEHLQLISQATGLLPDGNAAIGRLKEQFLWTEILHAMGYHELHIELLRAISVNSTIELPRSLRGRAFSDDLIGEFSPQQSTLWPLRPKRATMRPWERLMMGLGGLLQPSPPLKLAANCTSASG